MRVAILTYNACRDGGGMVDTCHLSHSGMLKKVSDVILPMSIDAFYIRLIFCLVLKAIIQGQQRYPLMPFEEGALTSVTQTGCK